jgi:hypothetical protein
MTGPEHYCEAERLQRHAAELAGSFEGTRAASKAERDNRAAVPTDAQVHATLALAAALGLSAGISPVTGSCRVRRLRRQARREPQQHLEPPVGRSSGQAAAEQFRTLAHRSEPVAAERQPGRAGAAMPRQRTSSITSSMSWAP